MKDAEKLLQDMDINRLRAVVYRDVVSAVCFRSLVLVLILQTIYTNNTRICQIFLIHFSYTHIIIHVYIIIIINPDHSLLVCTVFTLSSFPLTLVYVNIEIMNCILLLDSILTFSYLYLLTYGHSLITMYNVQPYPCVLRVYIPNQTYV